MRNTTPGREAPATYFRLSPVYLYDASTGLCLNGPWLDDSLTYCAVTFGAVGFGGSMAKQSGPIAPDAAVPLFGSPSGGEYASNLATEVRVEDVPEGTDFTSTLNAPVAIVLRIAADHGQPGNVDYWLLSNTPCEYVTVVGSAGLCG
jgi:hypothetical protein